MCFNWNVHVVAVKKYFWNHPWKKLWCHYLILTNPRKLPVLYLQRYKILQGLHIPPTTFTSCHDPGSNLQPPDVRSDTFFTEPIRLPYYLTGSQRPFVASIETTLKKLDFDFRKKVIMMVLTVQQKVIWLKGHLSNCTLPSEVWLNLASGRTIY